MRRRSSRSFQPAIFRWAGAMWRVGVRLVRKEHLARKGDGYEGNVSLLTAMFFAGALVGSAFAQAPEAAPTGAAGETRPAGAPGLAGATGSASPAP